MQIPENEFISKMTGRNETPIEKLGGFHKPDDELHEQIRERVHKKMRREIATSILWTLVSLIFLCIYVYLLIKSLATGGEFSKSYMMAMLVFAIMVLISIYRFYATDRVVLQALKNKSYDVRKVTIHHIMPNMGRPIAKIQDENGTVYYYEFPLNRKLNKIFKNDNEAEFTLIKFGQKRNIYSLTYFEREESETAEPVPRAKAGDCFGERK